MLLGCVFAPRVQVPVARVCPDVPVGFVRQGPGGIEAANRATPEAVAEGMCRPLKLVAADLALADDQR